MTYNSVHKRLRRVRGSASDYVCSCGEPAVEWAYQHTGDLEFRTIEDSFPYSNNLDDYVAMCRSCHQHLDSEKDLFGKRRENGVRQVETLAKRRRRCLQCGLVGTPGGMGTHQRYSRHTGLEEVEVG